MAETFRIEFPSKSEEELKYQDRLTYAGGILSGLLISESIKMELAQKVAEKLNELSDLLEGAGHILGGQMREYIDAWYETVFESDG